MAQGMPSTGAMRVQDPSSGAMLRVTHYGGLLVTLFNDPEYWGTDRSTTISHVQAVIHVAGIIRGFGPQGTNVVDQANAALQVNCVVGCSASTPGSVPHITSVTHVAGGISLINQAGTYVTVTGTALDVNCTGCSAASVTAVSHISAMTHVSGLIVGFGKQNTDVVDVPNASLKVSQGPARWPVSHVTSVTHVTLGISPRMSVFQVTNCGSTAQKIISSNPSRKSLRLRNVGTLPMWINGGHVTVSSSNGWTLHAVTTAANTTETSVMELPDFQGQIDCVSTGPVKVEVMEILR